MELTYKEAEERGIDTSMINVCSVESEGLPNWKESDWMKKNIVVD